jgi:hypothetical protein
MPHRALARRRGGRRPGVKEVQSTQPLVPYAILLRGTTLPPYSRTLAATSRSPGIETMLINEAKLRDRFKAVPPRQRLGRPNGSSSVRRATRRSCLSRR